MIFEAVWIFYGIKRGQPYLKQAVDFVIKKMVI
jgi:hypothetical protein